MNSTHAFLFEVIVDRLDIREKKTKEKTKAVGFDKGSLSSTAIMSDNKLTSASNALQGSSANTKVGRPLCSVVLSFGDFDPIVIDEDLTPDIGERERQKEEFKDPKSSETDEARELEEKTQARAAGLSPKEYQDTKKKNPDLLTEKKFTIGKSTLIRMLPTEMIDLLNTEKLYVTIEGGWTYSINLGSAAVDFPSTFVDAVVTAAYSSAMREMIAREGHIWWPKHMYRPVMLKEVRQMQELLQRKKMCSRSQEEKDLSIRFSKLCELGPLPKPCQYCNIYDDPSTSKPLTYADLAPPKKPKKKRTKIDRKGEAWLMYPSPEPITPPTLPTVAQMTEVVDVIDDAKKPTVIVSLFVRLSCFGNALELNRRDDPFAFPD